MRFIFGLVFLSLVIQVQGQNLVRNPSFEAYSQCPNSSAQLSYADFWYDQIDCTSDYFNGCSTNGWGVPNNVDGEQPARTGNAYTGIGVQGNNIYGREYITGVLTDTLIQGQKYCVEFYVSLCGGYSSAGIDRVGAYLTSNVMFPLYDPILVNPQIESDSVIKDTTLWTRIAGTFIAAGGECFITIGCFRPDSLITFDTIWPSSQPLAYYYIDDVSVIRIADCVAGNNTVICFGDSLQLGVAPNSAVAYSWQPATGLNDSTISNPTAIPLTTTTYTLTQTECDAVSTATVTVTVRDDCNTSPFSGIVFAPSPSDGNTYVYYDLSEIGTLEIYNMLGQLVWLDELPPGDRREDIFLPLAQGLYCWRVRSGGVYVGQGKVEITR